MKPKDTSLFQRDQVVSALKHSFIKLNPKVLFRNPVMFTVEIGTAIMLYVTIYSAISHDKSQGSFAYNLAIFFILLFTVLFANFAEAIAEARGKARQIHCAKHALKPRLK